MYFSGSAFCLIGIGVPDKAPEWFPLGFVDQDKLFEVSLLLHP